MINLTKGISMELLDEEVLESLNRVTTPIGYNNICPKAYESCPLSINLTQFERICSRQERYSTCPILFVNARGGNE
ncbi:hypothetical protein J4233_04335 [Candidatus Pacearchaeota archaeon]|nr:hypothetical protein [Candidatus Pacearchaeota archaeon]